MIVYDVVPGFSILLGALWGYHTPVPTKRTINTLFSIYPKYYLSVKLKNLSFLEPLFSLYSLECRRSVVAEISTLDQ